MRGRDPFFLMAIQLLDFVFVGFVCWVCVDVRTVGRLRREDGEGMANVDEFRIIIGDIGCGNGAEQSEVVNVAECRGSAGG